MSMIKFISYLKMVFWLRFSYLKISVGCELSFPNLMVGFVRNIMVGEQFYSALIVHLSLSHHILFVLLNIILLHLLYIIIFWVQTCFILCNCI